MTLYGRLHTSSAAPMVLRTAAQLILRFLRVDFSAKSIQNAVLRFQPAGCQLASKRGKQGERATQLQRCSSAHDVLRDSEGFWNFEGELGRIDPALAAIAFCSDEGTLLQKQLGAVQSLRYTTCVSHASARACILLDS